MSLQTGQILDGKYRIVRELGRGAMGAVYQGENVRIRRKVAIKVLHPAVAAKSDVVQRFEREAQAAGRIGSEHIVEVLDLGSLPDGGLYMVMEFLEGMTLSQRIRGKGRLAPQEIAPIAQQLLIGLEAAHGARIIHRDLKPDNVFLTRDQSGGDFVKILDFGVSKFNPLDSEMSMTTTGAVVGTPFYMSPEQAKGAREIDARSDIYAVGVILFEAVTGQKPFHAGTFNELVFKIVLETPPPPETFVPDLDPAFSRIVRRAMAREPSERFQSAKQLGEALSVWLHTGRDPNFQAAPPPPQELEMATVVFDGGGDEQTQTRIGAPSPIAGTARALAAASSGTPPPVRQTMPTPAPAQAAFWPQQAAAAPAEASYPPPEAAMRRPTPSNYPAEGWPAGVPGKRSKKGLVAALAGAIFVAGAGIAAFLFIPRGSSEPAAAASSEPDPLSAATASSPLSAASSSAASSPAPAASSAPSASASHAPSAAPAAAAPIAAAPRRAVRPAARPAVADDEDAPPPPPRRPPPPPPKKGRPTIAHEL